MGRLTKMRKREPEAIGSLAPPAWLDAPARRVFRKLAKILGEMNVGRLPDSERLARYCRLLTRWRHADGFIREHGESYRIKDEKGKTKCRMPYPEVAILSRLEVLLHRTEQEFGLTAAVRAPVETEPPLQ
jgi:P27 family predicted phage terminase small subunit